MTSAFIPYLDNSYVSIDEEHSTFRQFIIQKKVKSWNWVCTRGDELGAISFHPVPDSFFEQNLTKAQKRQYNVLQAKLKQSSLQHPEFKPPIILYVFFNSSTTNGHHCFCPIFSKLSLMQSSKIVVNELAQKKHAIYVENQRAFLSLDVDPDTMNCLQECETFFANLRAEESKIKSNG